MSKTKRCSIFLSMLAFLAVTSGRGQEYNFRIYSVEHGLAQSQINCICQDSKGYLWFATHGGGVSRFDGRRFRNYTEKDGLCDNVVYSIIEDHEGNLWLGTDRGVNKFDGQHFSHLTGNKVLKDACVWTILEDRQFDLWFGTYSRGVFHFDGDRISNYDSDKGLAGNWVICLTQDRMGNLWLGTDKGASKYDGVRFVSYNKKKELINDRVRSLLEDQKGDLWFATAGGVSRFDGSRFSHYTEKEGLCDNRVLTVMQDSRGDYWFTTENGVSRFNGSRFTTYTEENGLSLNYVGAILEDREGNIWLGTDSGITRYGGKTFMSVAKKHGLPHDSVWAICETPDGTMWIGTEEGIGLYRRGKDKSSILNLDGKNGKAVAYLFYYDSKGNLWFGSDESNIIKYDGKKFTNFCQTQRLGKVDLHSILEDQRGNIWFGTKEKGVIRYNGKTCRYFSEKDGLIHNTVNTMVQDKWKRIWLGTDGGISVYDGSTFENISESDGLPSRYVITLLTDSEGSIWAGTYGGGAVKISLPADSGDLKMKSFDTFSTADGLSDDEVLLMIFDDSGNLWLGTNKGINKLDLAEYNRTGRKSIRLYSKEDGFMGIECNQNAVYKDRRGKIWFGTVKGAIRYDPAEDRLNPVEPLTHLIGVKLFYEPADLSPYAAAANVKSDLPSGLTLPYNQNHLTFEFVGICLTAPERVRYRFMLAGFDKDWSPVTEATLATYSNVPPGDYSFRLKACNNNGVWNREPTMFKFTITSPFWQKWWFYLMVGLLGIGGMILFIRLRIVGLKNRQKGLEEKIQERTRELSGEKQKVEQINRELENRVQERTEKLIQANKQLLQAQKMEAIGTLAGGVAHDLNNVLAGIVSYPDMLLREIPESDPSRSYVLTIKKSGEKAAAIVQDLLTLASKNVEIGEAFNLNELIVEHQNSPEYRKLLTDCPSVQVETHLGEGLFNILGSRIHLNKILMNLIANAVEAMPGGGKTVISTANVYLDKFSKEYGEMGEGDFVRLAVSDSGVGIPPMDIERVFEPFYTKKKLGRRGTGLGMAVVWAAVKEHKGYIKIDSEEGKGTTVSTYFPKSDRTSRETKPPPLVGSYDGGGESILVVDDELEQRKLFHVVLSKLGYTVETVASGEEAVTYLNSHSADLVVLDMILGPGLDGLDTYKKILEINPHQRAIIVSGYSESERVKEAQSLGAGTYIKKPFLIAELGRAVKAALNRPT